MSDEVRFKFTEDNEIYIGKTLLSDEEVTSVLALMISTHTRKKCCDNLLIKAGKTQFMIMKMKEE